MCCQRLTARPNRHKSIRGGMKRAKAWCVCPLSCQGGLMGTKQHIRWCSRTDQPSGAVKNEKTTLVECVPDHKAHPAGSQLNQPFNPTALSSDGQCEAGGLNPPVEPAQTPGRIYQIWPQEELPREFNNATLYSSASTFTASGNCEITHADFHFTTNPSNSNRLHLQFLWVRSNYATLGSYLKNGAGVCVGEAGGSVWPQN